MKKTLKKVLTFVMLSALILGMGACAGDPEPTYGPLPDNLDFNASLDGIKIGAVNSGVSVHDPSILKVGDTYYIYGSHMAAAKCTDLLKWKRVADGYGPNNPMYGQIYSVADEAFAYAGSGDSLIPTDDRGVHVWAPDVVYNKHTGLYYMYYCTTSTWNASNLCYGVSATPEGPFEWKGALIYSGFDMETVKETDVLDYVSTEHVKDNYIYGGGYNYRDFPNAIDPSVFYDQDGRMWMVYGSWSGGIFLLELDPETGLVIHPKADPENDVDPYFGKKLLGGDHKSIEGPYILYADGYYYLFVSYGTLTADGGYQIRVFRSETVDGQYVDMNGGTPYGGGHASYGLKLSGNYNLPSLHRAYKATGHNSAFNDDDGKHYIVYHTRFENNGEMHSPRVHQFLTNAEGWPCMLPYQTQGETVSDTGYSKEEVVGRYYVINQGTAIDDKVAQPFILYFLEDGRVAGDGISGFWTATEGTYHMTVSMGEKTYSGVFCKMPDEAGTECMTFSAVGSNESVWGVKYA